MTRITPDIIRQHFPASTFERGQEYFRRDLVEITRISPDQTRIDGLVQGSGRMAYRVSAHLGRSAARHLQCYGRCSCPVSVNCKHVVALLLCVAERQVQVGTAGTGMAAVPTLSEDVVRWLDRMKRASRSASDEYPPDVRRRLIYLLSLNDVWGQAPRLLLDVLSVGLLKDGSFSRTVNPFRAGTAFGNNPGQFLRESDFAILSRLPGQYAQHALSGESGAELLEMVLRTGRARWESLDGPPLHRDEPRHGTIDWRCAEDGRHTPVVVLESDDLLLPLAPPWYLSPQSGQCGPVELNIPHRLAEVLLSAPPIALPELSAVRQSLAEIAPQASAFHPPQLEEPQKVAVPPVPHLRLHARMLESMEYRPLSRPQQDMVMLGSLSFVYQGCRVTPGQTNPRPVFARNGQALEIQRDFPAERRAARTLDGFGFLPLNGQKAWRVPHNCLQDLCLEGESDVDTWLDFLLRDVPLLQAEGWQVEQDESFPLKLVEPDGPMEADLHQGSGVDWFDLHLGITVDGQRLDLLPLLLRVLRVSGDEMLGEAEQDPEQDAGAIPQMMLVPLDDGRVLSLPLARVLPILRTLRDLFNGDVGDSLSVSRSQAADLAELAHALPELVWNGGESLRQLGERLRTHGGLPSVVLPDLFGGQLRPYQQSGLEWMQLLRDVGLGGVLADDMGLGKTVQTLAHIAVEKASGRMDCPCLVVAPTSLMANWQAEVARFTPSLSVLILQGNQRKSSFDRIARQDVVCTTYPLLARDAEVLTAQPWHMVILDEAQNVKNPATAAAKMLRGLTARHRLALSGTPLENHLGELWALFDFISPGFLGDRNHFTRTWRTPIEKKGDQERRAALARRVKPFLLRRTKNQVAADLPSKTEILEPVELSPGQRDLYEALRLTMHKKVREAIAAKGLQRSRIEFLDALLKLRQSCCDPRLVKSVRGKARIESAKLIRLMEMLPELIEEGRRILLFSQFTSMLALIEAELQAMKIPYVLLTGDTRDRATPVQRFQQGEVPLFLISLKAGGTGLNLTAADTVIHYDPWWNPAVEAQATDRAHRIGQDKPVFVYKLVVQDSIEEKMSALKLRKQALADGLFDPDSGGSLELGEDDIEFLLGEESQV